jgi:NAD+--dinitrogen-reductase ADP-D-ribosyltransferase
MAESDPGPVAINLCRVPPWVIATDEFNKNPVPLEIAGVRRSNRWFFSELDGMDSAAERARLFQEFITVKFALHEWDAHTGSARRSLRNSYIRFLRGWGVESSSIEGAVLKGWVQSRFGILPTYHRGILRHGDGEEDQRFARDRMKGSMRTNAIFSQLDLLYEFCQYELARRWPGRVTLTLFRGTNDPEEHPIREIGARRESCVRLNNLCSFTADRERAWEFGSTVWQTTVASAKIVFFSELFSGSLLKGEREFLVIGGDYWVKELLY